MGFVTIWRGEPVPHQEYNDYITWFQARKALIKTIYIVINSCLSSRLQFVKHCSLVDWWVDFHETSYNKVNNNEWSAFTWFHSLHFTPRTHTGTLNSNRHTQFTHFTSQYNTKGLSLGFECSSKRTSGLRCSTGNVVKSCRCICRSSIYSLGMVTHC